MSMMNLLAQLRGDASNIVYTVLEEPSAARARYIRNGIATLEAKSFLSSEQRVQLEAWRNEQRATV